MNRNDINEKFFQCYQKAYDFNTSALDKDDILKIKKIIKEKRAYYGNAPIGIGVFDWILSQSHNLKFELVDFKSKNIDGLLYIPSNGKERAYIILNSNKPLINQIFTSLHEYYNYIYDYIDFRNNPYICDFTDLKTKNEKMASRFAAEMLLPEEALKEEYRVCQEEFTNKSKVDFLEMAVFCMYLTYKYAMPLKAVVYRLYEENYIKDVDRYIKSYDFIKQVLRSNTNNKRLEELYGLENKYIPGNDRIYVNMEKAYINGIETYENIIKDAEKLKLDKQLIDDFIDENEEDLENKNSIEEEDDDVLFALINKKEVKHLGKIHLMGKY